MINSLNGSKLYIGSDIPIVFSVVSPDETVIDTADLFFYVKTSIDSQPILTLSNTTGELSKAIVTSQKIKFSGSIPQSFTTSFTKPKKLFYHSKVITSGKHRIDRSYIGSFTLELP